MLTLALLWLGCAGQVPPDGGPVDKEPPQIISTYPANYTTLFRDNKIALEFDEYVDRRSVEESIFISPFAGELEFGWSGREVEVRFSEPLRENRTYVVNVGTDVVDVHNRNRMAQAFTLAFSTGELIDRGAIEGRVYAAQAKDPPEGVMVFAYLLVPGAPDTLNPRTTKPDYITQTGKNGDFALRYLIIGKYRLLAVRDEYRNLLYDPETDDFGVPTSDVQLSFSDTLREDIVVRLAKEDTTAPRLIKITPQDQTHLLAEFSESVDTTSVVARSFSIQDTVANTMLTVKAAAVSMSKLSTVLLVTERQGGEKPYRLTATGILDLVGNEIHPLAKSLNFAGSGLPDTSRPSLASFSIADSTRGVEQTPTFQMSFSDLTDRASVEQAVLLQDSVGSNVEYTLKWLNDATLELRSPRTLKSKTWHVASVALARVKSINGVSGPPLVRKFRFETIDAETLSSIEGTVLDRSSVDTVGSIFLTAENLTQKDAKSQSLRLEKSGKFEFRNLREGQYFLRAFRDRNGNGAYDAGRPYPYEPSERFAVYPDTLKLRARWPLEGVMLELR